LFLGKDIIKVSEYRNRNRTVHHFDDLVFHKDDQFFYMNGKQLTFTYREAHGQRYDTIDIPINDKTVTIYARKALRCYNDVYHEKNPLSENQMMEIEDYADPEIIESYNAG
jgi:hypothetical protein